MAAQKRTWTNKLNEVRKNKFVGRQDEQRYFSDNFVGAEPQYLLYSVTGEGGVGKSTLLLQYEQIARSPSINAIVIRCDDAHTSPAAAMAFIAEQLKKEGFSNKEFDDRLKAYRAAREEIENDPKAPRGALNLVVRGATDFAVKFARKTPGVGVFAEYVDEKAAGEAVSQGVNYVIDRWGNKDETRLVREPEQVLTPLFMKLLAEACAKRKIVLMFDVFERTADALEPWLHALLTGSFGEVELNATFVIGGRDALDQRWTSLAGAICYVALEPFTFDETRDYLSRQDITDDPLVRQIYEDTSGLPVLVELLASRKPQSGQALPDISGDAVERFLSWIPDDGQRWAVLLAAVPRQFNRDVLSAAWGNDATSQFAWLTSQSFVRTSTARGAFFHEKVRELMLRHMRQTAPDALAQTHTRLCDHFESQQADLNLNSKAAYESKGWRTLEVERIYHALSQQTFSSLTKSINAFVVAFRRQWRFCEAILHALEQASNECRESALREMADALRKFYVSWDEDDHERFIAHATSLLSRENIESLARADLYGSRGETYRHMGKFDDALKDFDRAIELDNKYAWAIASRGETYRQMGRFDEALKDFDLAIGLDDKFIWAIGSRGETYRQMGKFDDALKDFDLAIELDDKNASAIGLHGETYRQMGKFDEALVDLTRAIELDDKLTWAITSRGETYRHMGKFDDALKDFDRAIELDGKLTWAIASRGETYRHMGKFDDALKDFDRAIELDDKYAWAIASRGETYRQMGRFDEALKDFDLAIELDDKYAWITARRGETYRQMGRFDEALKDLTRATDLSPEYDWIIWARVITLIQSGQFIEALADMDQALRLDGKDAEGFAGRSALLRRINRLAEALTDANRALELDQDCLPALIQRAAIHRQLSKYEQANEDVSRALAIPLKDEYLYEFAVAYVLSGKHQESVRTLRRAIELDSVNRNYAQHDDLLDPVRSMPEFQKLIYP